MKLLRGRRFRLASPSSPSSPSPGARRAAAAGIALALLAACGSPVATPPFAPAIDATSTSTAASTATAQVPPAAGGDEAAPHAVHPSVPLPPALARVLRDYERAWQARDAAGLAALFAPDGFVLPSGRPPVRGRAAIEAHYQGSGGPLALRALDHRAEGDVAFIIGGYARAPGEPDVGKFTLTLVRDAGGRWLIRSDMDNGNRRDG